METCVLIPSEFSLVLISSSESKISETGVCVWSNQKIPRGRRFLPFQGTFRLDNLEVYSYLQDSDVRHNFGCFDDVQQIDARRVRHCNWVRFLRISPILCPEVNLIGSLVEGEPIYEVIRNVAANTELVAYYEALKVYRQNPFSLPSTRRLAGSQYRHAIGLLLEESPLDLSKSLLFSSAPVLDRNSQTLNTTPFETDKRRSISSDWFPTGEESVGVEPRQVAAKKARERPLLPCEVCGKAFDRPSLLGRHMRTHTGEKPHVCDVCGKGFSTSSSLNTHRRIHSGEKPHQCHVCGKRFTASSNLYYHRMTHSKEKPHKCTVCAKSFPTPGDLKSHMYVHNGSWPFKCHTCNRGFSKQTNLKNHLFLHTGAKPHVCWFCQKRFALACNLRAHLKTHEGDLQERTVSKTAPPTSAMHESYFDCYNKSSGVSLIRKHANVTSGKTVSSKPSPSSSLTAHRGGTKNETSPAPLLVGIVDQLMLKYRNKNCQLSPLKLL